MTIDLRRTLRLPRTGAVASLALLLAGPAVATSPWIPEENDLLAGSSFVFETFDEYYGGTDLNDFPPGHLHQYTTRMFLDYGIGNDLAFDASLGFTATTAPLIHNDRGLDDTFLGLRWRALDEFEESRWMPTVSLRLGGIIAGTYDTDRFPAAAGTGASGVEVQAAIGKLLGYGLGASTEVGYRAYNRDVPDDWRVRAQLSKTFFDRATLEAGINHKHAVNGIDLGDPGFTPQRSPELQEIYTDFEAGLALQDDRGFDYRVFYARTLDGRNTGRKNIAGASITIPFRFGRAESPGE